MTKAKRLEKMQQLAALQGDTEPTITSSAGIISTTLEKNSRTASGIAPLREGGNSWDDFAGGRLFRQLASSNTRVCAERRR